jgi:homoserine O-acetyltransferase
VQARSTVIAINTDRLFPPYQQEQLAALLGDLRALEVVQSLYGHDGFLIEIEQVGKLIAEALED